MNLSDIKKRQIAYNQIERVKRRTSKNATIADFYEDLAEEEKKIGLYGEISARPLFERSYRVRCCGFHWEADHYPLQGVKDLVRTYRCKDRFCDNCQNWLSIQRYKNFAPLLEELQMEHDIYHMVFTVPNVLGEELLPTIDRMYREFAYINRLFKGDAKIRGLDFLKYDYYGAIRSLEITKNRIENTFHPHFHCLVILKKDCKLDRGRKIVNRFSFNNPDVVKLHRKKKDYGEPERYFSPFEILMQKIWRMRYEGIKLTLQNINACKEGFSVIVEKATSKRFKEIFKYVTKGIFKEGDSAAHGIGYDFLALYYALKNRRLIQGYGALRCLNFEEVETSKIRFTRK